jgi:hypothetical protein
MGERSKVTDSGKLMLLYERFRDVCLVEKEVWKEVFLPREMTSGPVRTNIQDRYAVEIDDPIIEDTLEANIPRGGAALMAVIHEHRSHISFFKSS